MAASCVLGLALQEGRYENDMRINQRNELTNPSCLWLNCFLISSLNLLKGFYYDAYYNDLTLNEEHFSIIENQAQKAVTVSCELLTHFILVFAEACISTSPSVDHKVHMMIPNFRIANVVSLCFQNLEFIMMYQYLAFFCVEQTIEVLQQKNIVFLNY